MAGHKISENYYCTEIEVRFVFGTLERLEVWTVSRLFEIGEFSCYKISKNYIIPKSRFDSYGTFERRCRDYWNFRIKIGCKERERKRVNRRDIMEIKKFDIFELSRNVGIIGLWRIRRAVG